jgi:hypothetical protein
MPGNLFETECWFKHLTAHGFEQPPRHFELPLSSASGAQTATLHLMRGVSGGPLCSLANYYSGLYGPVGTPDQVSSVDWDRAAQDLSAFPGSSVVRIQPLDASSAWLVGLEAGMRANGYWTDRYFCFGNWYQPRPDEGFSSYWAQRPSALRHSVERGRRRLERAGGWRVQILTAPSAELEAGITAYLRVYAASWKTPEPCPNFMPGLANMAAHLGWLRLGVLWLRGEPIAAQIWLVHGGKANIYKLAHVVNQDRFSAGSVLTAALMEYVMNTDKVREVDYLTGDDAYKRNWMASRRERIGLIGFHKRSAQGLGSGVLHFSKRYLKLLVNR